MRQASNSSPRNSAFLIHHGEGFEKYVAFTGLSFLLINAVALWALFSMIQARHPTQSTSRSPLSRLGAEL